jgi:cell wall-associated NlpC family hydrolase
MFWFGDEVPTPDLYGRQFRHGVTDCYGLVRDYYRVTYGILIKNYPRDDEWWNHGGNLLLDYFADAGFYRIDAVDKPGDVVLAEVLSKVPNHCGVHVGNGELLHHLTDRPSRIDQLGHWMKFVRMSLRYEGL